MVRLTLLLVLLAGPVASKCFGPPFPKVVHFEGGRTVHNLSHSAQDLTYDSLSPDGSPSVTTLRNGLFVTAATSHGVTYGYTWITPLPEVADLAPGFHQTFKADMTVEHATRSFFQSDVEVLRREVVQVDACDYDVVVVHRADTLNGRLLGETTNWLSTTLHFALRVEGVVDGKTQTFAVQSME